MAEQKKINEVFGIGVIAFLVVMMVVTNNINHKRFNDEKEYVASLVNLVHVKNNRLIVLAKQLAQKQMEYDNLQKTLVDTRNNLETLSKKLAETKRASCSSSTSSTSSKIKDDL
jgi:septal ring factor EnvC (AmiA/AmiB activator)